MEALKRVALGLYVLWLVAVVLVVISRLTTLPMLPGTYSGVVVGTVIFVCLGAGRLLRAGYLRLAG